MCQRIAYAFERRIDVWRRRGATKRPRFTDPFDLSSVDVLIRALRVSVLGVPRVFRGSVFCGRGGVGQCTQASPVEAPWGGYKKRGFGRELGRWSLDEYLQVKQVYINLDEAPIGWY